MIVAALILLCVICTVDPVRTIGKKEEACWSFVIVAAGTESATFMGNAIVEKCARILKQDVYVSDREVWHRPMTVVRDKSVALLLFSPRSALCVNNDRFSSGTWVLTTLSHVQVRADDRFVCLRVKTSMI